MKGYIHSIETFGTVDGPGIRYVIFLQGCPMRCLFCHNPDSWNLKDGKLTSVKSIIKNIKSYKNYITSGGVTLSGGEPLMQPKFTYKLVKELKKQNFHIALDTAGSVDIGISKKIIDLCDLVMLDIKGLDNDLNMKISSLPVKNTLDTLAYCEEIKKPVQIRQVLVKDYTLNDEYLHKLAKYLTQFKCIDSVDLLPFHKMGEHKWKSLNLDYKLYDTPATNQDELKHAKEIFKSYNLPII